MSDAFFKALREVEERARGVEEWARIGERKAIAAELQSFVDALVRHTKHPEDDQYIAGMRNAIAMVRCRL